MQYNLILAGVGGQGILTIAHMISRAAMRRGYDVRQSEVHGMSQRGGAVQSHVRFSDKPLHSDLIPLGEADMILAVEPLEALRYVEYLREQGVIVSSAIPFVNIPHYPPVEEVLDRIASHGDHLVVDAARVARAAGSARAENMAMLGAAASCMDFHPDEFSGLIAEAFSAKGERIVQINERAFRLGHAAAALYRDGIQRGARPREVRAWLDKLSADELVSTEHAGAVALAAEQSAGALSASEAQALQQVFESLREEGREALYEHEAYNILQLVGGLAPPRHHFVPRGEHLADDALNGFSGDRVVLKIVSPDLAHKSDTGGVAFVTKSVEDVNRSIDRLIAAQSRFSDRIAGVLVVEFIEQAEGGLGSELFVGMRVTRAFGPVIAAGLGGVDTEFLAEHMERGMAVAKAPVEDVTAESFLELFRRTAAYELVTGRARGHERVVSDGELIRCFRAFIAIARRFGMHNTGFVGDGSGDTAEHVGLIELEVNPFAFAHQRMIPLDGRGRLGALPIAAPPRSKHSDVHGPEAMIQKDAPGDPSCVEHSDAPGECRHHTDERVDQLLEPTSIAVIGVSGKRANFGRIILNNIVECGFPRDRLYVIKEDMESIDGVRCVPSLAELPERVDLLVAATSADRVAEVVDQVIAEDTDKPARCSSVILIPGALGEKEGTADVQEAIREKIESSRRAGRDTPVFLGGNCMGVRSRPGQYDTFFIPKEKLDPRRRASARRMALISQSGAFIITRMSNLECLDPALAVSLGNQVDLTVSDVLNAVAARDDIDCIGVYVEGFNDLDGLAFIRSVRRATASGKVVVFYKAGRTDAGRSAAQGHTASLAGDYDVCDASVAAAGAIVTETFKEFEQLLELSTDLHGKDVHGRRVGAISNAGYETVGMADTVKGTRYQLEIPPVSDGVRARLETVLARHELGALVNARNPLDLTPMASDQAYEDCARVMLESDEFDAVIVGCVPMTPQLLTTPSEIGEAGSIARRIPTLFREYDKPLLFVVDCMEPYNALARAVREAGVPVFRTADQAVRSLGRYLCHRTSREVRSDPAATVQEFSEPVALPVMTVS
jgi:indolepyruvate ferredoxin oxidoreductase beta subunit